MIDLCQGLRRSEFEGWALAPRSDDILEDYAVNSSGDKVILSSLVGDGGGLGGGWVDIVESFRKDVDRFGYYLPPGYSKYKKWLDTVRAYTLCDAVN
jgi:hypothetical protein